jgi:hypothetical protein
MKQTNLRAKNTSNFLSQQVKQILNSKGYSFLFNWNDYTFFKNQAKNAFNKAHVIADLFISESETNSDFNEYIF